MNGFLLLDKPAGRTSFACVARVRRLLGVKRVGHTGTLDPRARGLLILLIGTATKTQERFLSMPKQYRMRAELGRQSTTGDAEGDICAQKPFESVTAEKLEKALKHFHGEIQQTPPMYSALKHKGKPYYRYARQGVEIPRFARPVTIYSFDLLSFESPFWEARVRCSRGTYVRTLAEDVAIGLGTVGMLADLVRERIGDYSVEDALPWSAIEEGDKPRVEAALHPVLDGELTHA